MLNKKTTSQKLDDSTREWVLSLECPRLEKKFVEFDVNRVI
jgi:hypothetical protein